MQNCAKFSHGSTKYELLPEILKKTNMAMTQREPKGCVEFSILRVIIQAGTVSDTIKKESFQAPKGLPVTQSGNRNQQPRF